VTPADPAADPRMGGGAGRPTRFAALAGAALAFLVLGAMGMTGAFGPPEVQGLASEVSPLGTIAFHGPGGLAPAFPDGAPARVAGGFGGDTCLACHWEFDHEEDSVGSLQVTGLPEEWTPGTSYTLEIEVQRPGMAVGGFQLAARFAADTTQAGTFHIPDHDTERIAVLDEGGLLFAQHTEAGIPVDEGTGRIRWTVVWKAPATGGPGDGEVVLNISAVAGDGDRSQMGDYVYSAEFRVLH
jgi:hypothetical protein